MKKKIKVPKPRAINVHEILRSKPGGRHQEKENVRSHRKHQMRKEVNDYMKGSNWSPFSLCAN